jgi:hypothetical protein
MFFSTNGSYSWAEYFDGTRENWRGGIGLRTGKYLNLDATLSHTVFDLPIANGQFSARARTMQNRVGVAKPTYVIQL